MIVAVVVSHSFKNALKSLRTALGKADLVEVRFDYLKRINESQLEKIVKLGKSKIICTCRPQREGGKSTLSEKKRIEILKNCARFGAGYVDIEYSTSKKLLRDLIKNRRHSKIILSHHNFKKTPERNSLEKLFRKMSKVKGAHLLKIVTFAKEFRDNFIVFDLLQKHRSSKPKLIAFCIGEKGKASRIFCPQLGSFATYAALVPTKKSAEGQLSLNELKKYIMGE